MRCTTSWDDFNNLKVHCTGARSGYRFLPDFEYAGAVSPKTVAVTHNDAHGAPTTFRGNILNHGLV